MCSVCTLVSTLKTVPCTILLYMNYGEFLPLPNFKTGRLSSPQLPTKPLGALGRLQRHLIDEHVIVTLKLEASTGLAMNSTLND